ncbi:hypothetical protein HID58_076710 [Brassica napus]|uniref:Uncharacterized protein n=1 Tax=Brassica napus TaxID=3708 RepID=A0ABQ7YN92_BRANA|nr:hypothetical protein HID58_076710 [Brassica napus]
MSIQFLFHKFSRKTPPMKGLKLQCSSLKPPFKIHADLPDRPFALYLDPYLNPHLCDLSAYPFLS